jgi:hypothetical protein
MLKTILFFFTNKNAIFIRIELYKTNKNHFFFNFLGHVWQNHIFCLKQNCQNKSNDMFANTPLSQNSCYQNNGKPNKALSI